MSDQKPTDPRTRSASDPEPSRAIRDWYQDVGVDEYYRLHADQYENPHLPWIRKLIQRNHERLNLDKCLDFCCGLGEVSEVLLELGYQQVTGCDPYTHQLYRERLGLDCSPWSFEDLLQGQMMTTYSCMISSFALHLCPLDQLVPLVWQLFRCTKQLVILTPHKRPELEKIAGIELSFEDLVRTDRGKRIRFKVYRPLPPGC